MFISDKFTLAQRRIRYPNDNKMFHKQDTGAVFLLLHSFKTMYSSCASRASNYAYKHSWIPPRRPWYLHDLILHISLYIKFMLLQCFLIAIVIITSWFQSRVRCCKGKEINRGRSQQENCTVLILSCLAYVRGLRVKHYCVLKNTFRFKL